jgi:uncharacterized membrane protein
MITSIWMKSRRLLTIAMIAVGLFFGSVPSKPAQAMSPQFKLIAITSGYGAVAGALLGVASLAFGAESDAIFVGASLGLYTGLGVGTYMVLTEPAPPAQKSYPEDDYFSSDAGFLIQGLEKKGRSYHLPLVRVQF